MVRIIVEIVSKFRLHDLLEEKKKVWEKDIVVTQLVKINLKKAKKEKGQKLALMKACTVNSEGEKDRGVNAAFHFWGMIWKYHKLSLLTSHWAEFYRLQRGGTC